jgi:hypothetical protein
MFLLYKRAAAPVQMSRKKQEKTTEATWLSEIHELKQ